jgi:hypothetical protein
VCYVSFIICIALCAVFCLSVVWYFVTYVHLCFSASVVYWSEFLATDPEIRVRFPALADFLRSSFLERGPLSLVSCSSFQSCLSVSVYQCISVSVYQCIRVSVYPCIRVTVYECMSVWVYQCISVSVCQCISVYIMKQVLDVNTLLRCISSANVNMILHLLVVLERFQLKALRMIVEETWYVPNTVIRRDLQTPRVKEEISRYSSQYSARLSAHPNDLVLNLTELPDNRRLRRHLPNDLPTRFIV